MNRTYITHWATLNLVRYEKQYFGIKDVSLTILNIASRKLLCMNITCMLYPYIVILCLLYIGLHWIGLGRKHNQSKG